MLSRQFHLLAKVKKPKSLGCTLLDPGDFLTSHTLFPFLGLQGRREIDQDLKLT